MDTCQASYAYAAKVALEYAYYYRYEIRIDVPAHELIYCDQENNQCLGGYPERSFGYVKNYGFNKNYSPTYPICGRSGKEQAVPDIAVNLTV